MTFYDFRELQRQHFERFFSPAAKLYKIEVDKDEFWNLYLDSFPAGTNEIYITRREYDCSCCRHFIKTIGNVVTFVDGEIRTLWDFEINDSTFAPVVKALDIYLREKAVTDVFYSEAKSVGTKSAGGWDHFYLDIPNKFVMRDGIQRNRQVGAERDNKNVFRRSLEEFSLEAIDVLLELINSNTLYRGAEWKSVIEKFRMYKRVYDRIDSEEKREIFAWEKSAEAGPVIARIRNHSIGTLLIDISNDVDLDVAVRRYENIVAPANYKRPNAIFTKKMLEDAKKTITELGYMDSLGRRFATLDDISVNNILFANRDAVKRIKNTDDIFEEMLSETKTNPKRFDRVEEISIEKFIKDVLPTTSAIEAYLETRHIPNFCSIIAPKVADSKSMFKWNNNFSWAYSGNIADSNLKQNVKAAGGNVNGVLRFSIQWNDTNDFSENDLDAHCIEPDDHHIFYGATSRAPGRSHNGGQLDVDIVRPIRNTPAVENIVWIDKQRMRAGRYHFFVNQYCYRGGRDGFRAEIEFDGQIYSFDYRGTLRTGQNVEVADVILSKDGTFSIVEKLPSSTSSREVWGVKTNTFVPVSVMMYSPNYWDEQSGIGNKHYMFMLKDCVNSEEPNGFYNEFLKQELVEHKRVFEALGGKMAVESVDDQLSGLGFSSTKRDNLVVKVKGNTERIFRIKF